MTSIEVVVPGMLTTIQDLGRIGHRASGVGPGGAVDTLSHRVANLLVGNPADAAAFEITLLGPRLLFPEGAWVAISGAMRGAVVFTAEGESTDVPAGHPVWVPAGATLTCGPSSPHGCRSSLAVAGGLDVPLLLGGRGTDLRSGFGGWQGRALLTGDRIPFGASRRKPPADRHRVVVGPQTAPPELSPWPAGGPANTAASPPIRVLRGLEFDAFSGKSRAAFFTSTFVVTPDSDRSGCRLSGETLAAPTMPLSEVVVAGTIQVPPSGQPIVLAADHPVTGGYPRIAVVATIDLPRVGQAPPGAALRFVEVGLDEAQRLLRERERTLRIFTLGLEHLR
jgi:antagonist of KipI